MSTATLFAYFERVLIQGKAFILFIIILFILYQFKPISVFRSEKGLDDNRIIFWFYQIALLSFHHS